MGNTSSIENIVKNEKSDPQYREILDDILSVNKLFETYREWLKIDNIDVLFTTDISEVEAVMVDLDILPMNKLMLMTLIYIKRMDNHASSLFIDCIESNKDVFDHLLTMKIDDSWPKRFNNTDHTRDVVFQKNPFIHRSLERAVLMKRTLQFAMSKVLTEFNAFFRILDKINEVHALRISEFNN